MRATGRRVSRGGAGGLCRSRHAPDGRLRPPIAPLAARARRAAARSLIERCERIADADPRYLPSASCASCADVVHAA
jgi:hypothetical protein